MSDTRVIVCQKVSPQPVLLLMLHFVYRWLMVQSAPSDLLLLSIGRLIRDKTGSQFSDVLIVYSDFRKKDRVTQ